MKVIFIGGLTNGKIVYEYLLKNRYFDLQLTITYADNYNGPRHIIIPDGHNIIKSGTLKNLSSQIKKLTPDLIIVAGWSELIDEEILSIPRLGVIGFHPSKLPFDRGRSVLAWQIEEGYKETALSMFFYSTYPDGGDIIAQEKVIIETEDYINDVLDKIDLATYNLIHAYFPLIRKGLYVTKKQDLSEGNFRHLSKI
jgi:methionyl-tRNA formyltransferase